ncbi:S-adenosyl-L-methionine-dependent methyltransferase [Dactylonectria macrodidyma]|uniref:S-adenosyl-L-methionine-dependent methyltransferase n=1 Tax=Dactylonectria macrodidyma TaxID=307937 RepID=A0A9P9EB03_9HYPO|nr:S-adenosyl-L-methionine-dependent methyltransferase [Dactylonectria macrodidyma]
MAQPTLTCETGHVLHSLFPALHLPSSAMADQTSPARSPKTPPKSPSAEPVFSSQIEADSLVVTDEDGGTDADSAFNAGSLASSTTSISESILDYRKLHGRTYENVKTTEYWAPNDEQQNDGLDIIHNVLLMNLDDKLFIAPIAEHPARVLDIGTGTGIWAMDFAEQFPEAKVIGTDLSPIQPSWVPPNVEFVIDDCVQVWTWPANHFDFIHLRGLYGSIPDWQALYRQAFRHLVPGGWIQDLEMDVKIQSDHMVFPDDHIFNRWADQFYDVGEKTGRSFAVATGNIMRDNLTAVGFIDIVERKIKCPISGWPKDPKKKQAGILFMLALDESLDGFTNYLFTQILGWDKAEVVVFVAEYRKEMRKLSNCGWAYITVVYGRKPLTATG